MKTRGFRDRFSLLVYLSALILFFISIFPWGDRQAIWEGYKEESFIASREVEQAWQTREEIISRANAKGKDYGPEDFFQDQNILLPLMLKFQFAALTEERAISYKGIMVKSLYPAFRSAINYLEQKALDNFPYGSLFSKASQTEVARNGERWHKATTSLKGTWLTIEQLSSFLRWFFLCYLKFLPFGLFLICFQLWKRERSVMQELLLRPRTFFLSVFKGPFGFLEYSEIDYVLNWRYAKLHSQFLERTGKWRVTKQEQGALWLQAVEPALTFERALDKVMHASDVVTRRSKMAVLVGYGIMILTMPFLTVRDALSQRLHTSQIICSLYATQGYQKNEEEEGEDVQLFEVPVGAVMSYCFAWPQTNKPVRVKPGEAVKPWVNRGWFLPPSLAPPLN